MSLSKRALAPSPLGPLIILGTETEILGLSFASGRRPGRSEWTPALEACAGQLAEYFSGARTSFDLPLRFEGTPFQVATWEAVRRVPFGETAGYGEIAAILGRPGAARAVGRANGDNPFVIVVPCHRVVGRDGSLTGYGGGLERKAWLLEHERRLAARQGALPFPGTAPRRPP